ncbi:protealysin inhibitor emfourin [Nostoc sp. FACHB-133]|uniref:protealysin inhibitor emfourin n=1 Tax=Nostoc sp. FACHB-133 TaxID=2692835 RepID=UPI0018EFF1AB|nr:protealysin inhibitor emfourin [Nostoc sp. FACHB-133]
MKHLFLYLLSFILLLFLANQPISEAYSTMKVKFVQSGGYAGLRRGCEVDTNLLPSNEAAKLKSLVEQSGILQKAKSNHAPHARDLFNYNITVETAEGEQCNVSFDDLSLPEGIQPLLNYLQSCAYPLTPNVN